MFKYLFAFIYSFPRIIHSLISCNHMRKRKDKYPLEVRYAEVKKLAHTILKGFNVKFNIKHSERINHNDDRGRIYFCNHNSIADALIAIDLSDKPLIFISKMENSKNVLINIICDAIDTLMIDRNDVRQSLSICKTAGELCANENRNIIIFPEGTRSKDGNLLPFKAAFSSIIHYSKANTTMLVLVNTREIMKFRFFNFKRPVVNGHVFSPLSHEYYLEHKKDFISDTHDMMEKEINNLKSKL